MTTKNMNIYTKKKCPICYERLSDDLIKTLNVLDKSSFYFNKCKNCKLLVSQNYNRQNIYEDTENNTNFSNKKNKLFTYLKQQFSYFYIKRIINVNPNARNFLDYGCGSGEFSNSIESFGKKVFSCDVRESRPPLLNNTIKYYNDINLKDARELFDIILLRHSLEHIENPIETLHKLSLKLAENGIIIVEVPNLDSFHKRYMKSRWTGYFSPYHEFVFSKRSLEVVAEKLNLSVKIETTEPPIFGVYFMQYNISRAISRIFSLCLYPLQSLISKVTFSSEGLFAIYKK